MRPTILLLLAVGACSSVPRAGGRPPGGYGVFQIHEPVGNTRPPVTIEGTIQVRPDTLIVDVLPGPCRPEQSGPQSWIVSCNDLRLWFDRRDPIHRNSYSVRTLGYVTEKRCAQYARDSSGNSRCVREVTEYIEKTITRTGQLRPQKTD